MYKKKWILWICILLVAGGLEAKTQVQRYSPGPLPSIGVIQSMCVEEFPAPRDRITLGIGEDVYCWIDAKTWRDTDICTDAEGKQSEVADTLGEVVWAVQGAGTIYPIVTDGSTVMLTADMAGKDDTATVIATVRDSGTMGEDPPIQKQKTFYVQIPKGLQIIDVIDKPPAKKVDGK